MQALPCTPQVQDQDLGVRMHAALASLLAQQHISKVPCLFCWSSMEPECCRQAHVHDSLKLASTVVNVHMYMNCTKANLGSNLGHLPSLSSSFPPPGAPPHTHSCPLTLPV